MHLVARDIRCPPATVSGVGAGDRGAGRVAVVAHCTAVAGIAGVSSGAGACASVHQRATDGVSVAAALCKGTWDGATVRVPGVVG